MKHSGNSAAAFGFDWIKGNCGIPLPFQCSIYLGPYTNITLERDGRLAGGAYSLGGVRMYH